VAAPQLTYGEIFRRLSLMQLVTACPQLAAAALLLYYALTFQRDSSAFAHRMLVESFPHQAVLSLLVLALVRASLETATSLCCAFPAHWSRLQPLGSASALRMDSRASCSCVYSPMDAMSCRLSAILPCPPDALQDEHYRLYPRLAQFLASWLLVAAMASVGAAHTIRDMHLRYRRAEFVAFSRRQEAQPAPVSVKL